MLLDSITLGSDVGGRVRMSRVEIKTKQLCDRMQWALEMKGNSALWRTIATQSKDSQQISVFNGKMTVSVSMNTSGVVCGTLEWEELIILIFKPHECPTVMTLHVSKMRFSGWKYPHWGEDYENGGGEMKDPQTISDFTVIDASKTIFFLLVKNNFFFK